MDRRSFLGKVGGLGAAGVVLSALPIVEACSPDKKTSVSGGKVRLGMIGPGSRGQYHLANLQQIANAEVVALCDIYQPNHYVLQPNIIYLVQIIQYNYFS